MADIDRQIAIDNLTFSRVGAIAATMNLDVNFRIEALNVEIVRQNNQHSIDNKEIISLLKEIVSSLKGVNS